MHVELNNYNDSIIKLNLTLKTDCSHTDLTILLKRMASARGI